MGRGDFESRTACHRFVIAIDEKLEAFAERRCFFNDSF
jgi:hypothetical protein